VWKPLPSRRILKILRGSLKENVERGQYLLAVDVSGGFGHYFACQVAVGESIVLLSQVAVRESIVSRGEIIRRLSVAVGGWWLDG